MKIRLLLALALILLAQQTTILASRNNARTRHYRTKAVRAHLSAKSRHRFSRNILPAAGIYVQTLSGETILDQQSKQFFNPASVMKIATSYTALSKLGYNYRFPTEFYTDGTIDQSGTVNGDLIILGNGDPGFFTENAFLVMEKLTQSGIKTINGNLVVVAPFYLNFNVSTERSAELFLKIIGGKNWNREFELAWEEYKHGKVDSLPPGINLTGRVIVNGSNSFDKSKATRVLTHLSKPLYDILKSQNDFSNNFMAEAVGRYIGGPDVIEQFLIKDVGIPASEIKVVSASGLGANKITPQAALHLMRSFYQSVTKNGRRIEELMPVAGIDEGTLGERFTNPDVRGSVIAKTGTLPSKGASALVGVAYTKERGTIFFAILNRDAILRARQHQDELVMDLLMQCGGPLPQTARASDSIKINAPEVILSQRQPAR